MCIIYLILTLPHGMFPLRWPNHYVLADEILRALVTNEISICVVMGANEKIIDVPDEIIEHRGFLSI